MATSTKARETNLEPSSPAKQSKIIGMDGMCVDGPTSGLRVEVMKEAHVWEKAVSKEQAGSLVIKKNGPEPMDNKAPMVKGKKWKIIARETQGKTTAGLNLGGRVQESCKRRVNFEVPEPKRVLKKGKTTENDILSVLFNSTAEPAE
ncbi:hypothetical protein Q3G72_000751 [Acer saccharum]|nr:hypothetical protein Q3G72_000751 [Acer saccharum]